MWLPVLMAGGVALYFALPFEPDLFWLAAAPLAACGFLFARARPAFFVLFGALLAFAAGFNAAQIETRLAAAPMLEEKIGPASVTGTLWRAEALPEGARLVIKKPFIAGLPQEKTPLFVRFKIGAGLDRLPPPGARINVWGPLWPPGEPVFPGGYNFRRAAFFKQIGGTGVSYGRLRGRAASPVFSLGDRFQLTLEKARRALALTTLVHLTGREAAMTAALLTGSQTGIDPETMKAMRLSGLSHLLSISGVHVGMIAFLLYAPLRTFLALFPFMALRWPIKKIAAAVSIAGTGVYALLVGADPPTVRSALMAGLVLFAILADRKTLSLRLIALAAILVSLAAPSGVIGPSFQMSFAAVLAMVAAYEKRLDAAAGESVPFILPALPRFILRHGGDIVLTSLIATAATTPFTLFHFQTFSFYGVAANMIAIPLTTLWVMPCLLLTYLTAPFGLEALPLSGAGWGVRLTIDLAQKVAAWPFAQFSMPVLPLWAMGLFLLGGLWLCLWRGRLRLIGLLPLAAACFYPLFAAAPSVLIAPGGENWGVVLADGRLAVYGKRFDNFTAAQWKQRLRNPDLVLFGPDEALAANENLSCAAFICVYKKNGLEMAFLLKDAPEKEVAQACAEETGALFAPFDLPSDCRAPFKIDAAALHEHGAYALYGEKGTWRVETAREARGQRPWSAGWEKISISEPNRPVSPEP